VPFILGLTGNIACGKSTVGALLTERFGADYLDADRIVHELYAAGTPETREIAARFGSDLLQLDGTIDRRRLGDIVMADRAALKELEGMLEPGIRGKIEARLSSTAAAVLVLDAVRLIEGGLYLRCNAIWVVVCDPALQIQRLQDTRHYSVEQATLRVTAQAPIEDKLRHATAVIRNDGALDALEAQIVHEWERTVQPHLTVEAGQP
jgi:dephospho-CoA kinase